jgi:alkaline phosphatase D
MDRRRFLGLTAGVVSAPLWGGCAPGDDVEPAGDALPSAPPPLDADTLDGGQRAVLDVAAIPVDEATFPLGVQAGGMRGRAFTAWTRVPTPLSTTSLRLRVWRDVPADAAPAAQPGELVLVQDVVVTPGDEGTVKVVVDGLAPSTWYRYAFFVDGDIGRSVIGRVRTAWAEDWLWPVTIGATACTSPSLAPFTTLQRMAELPIDAFVHTGDMVYADGSRTADEYRGHWERALADPGYRALLVQQGGYFAWDDHEFDNNVNPEEMPATQLQTAAAAFFAHTPMTPNGDGGLWQSYVWGRTLELIVLDCRTERRPSTRATERPVYVGEAQMAWLKDRLKNSPCRFKVVVNSVPMTRMPELWPPPDRWQGYAAQRAEVLTFLQDEGIEDVWFLAGDFHVGFVGRVEPTGPLRRTWEVAVGPGGNLGNPLGFLATQDDLREQVFPADQFVYGRGELAATTVTFDPLRGEVRVRFVDVDGGTLFDRVIDRST